MSRNWGYALAVPQAALASGGTGARLAIDTAAWEHLKFYLDTVGRLPAGFGDGTAELSTAVAKVRREVQRFGTPLQARELLRDAANGSPAAVPPDPYAGLIWWVYRLQASAATVVATLQMDVDPRNAAGAARQHLQTLGTLAATVRAQLQPLTETLGSFKAGLTGANRDLLQAANASAVVLQQTQEAVGGMQVQVTALETRIANLGLLEGHKKPELAQRLLALRTELDDKRKLAERLRRQHGVIETLLRHGAWLEAALDGMATFLDKSRIAWTAFGSGVAQLAADATPAQLGDPALMEQKLERSKAIEQWTALNQAAQRFATQALADSSENAR